MIILLIGIAGRVASNGFAGSVSKFRLSQRFTLISQSFSSIQKFSAQQGGNLQSYPELRIEGMCRVNYSHPDNKIWYLNGDANAEHIYNDWCELVKPKMRITMYPLVPSSARDICASRFRKFKTKSQIPLP